MTCSESDNGGVLILAGSPIGDIDQVSPALIDILKDADLIAAEDTRRFQQLAHRLNIETKRLISYFEANEINRTTTIIDHIRHGAKVVLITDAGMPCISDPGYRLVKAAIEADLPLTCLPGPSAVLTALALSGLPIDRFCFEGFKPRKSAERLRRLTSLRREERTMVFFEAPHRLADFLADAMTAFSPTRQAVICREMTKRYEQVIRGSLDKLHAWANDHARGEITVVIKGAESTDADLDQGVDEAIELIQAGLKPSKAAQIVSKRLGLPRHELYARLVN